MPLEESYLEKMCFEPASASGLELPEPIVLSVPELARPLNCRMIGTGARSEPARPQRGGKIVTEGGSGVEKPDLNSTIDVRVLPAMEFGGRSVT